MGRFRTCRLAFLLGILACRAAGAQEFPPDLIHWVRAEEKPVFSGTGQDTWDKKIRERGWILIEDGVYHLWYTGYNTDRQDKSMHLGHATSADGLHWTRDPANPLADGSWVEDMCVIHEGDTYHMFAEGKGDIAHALSSTDRVHWKELGPLDIRKMNGEPLSAGPRGTPTVWHENGTWYLLYERGDLGIWLATSKDRDTWKNVSDDPVIPMGPDAYDRQAVAVNQVIKRDGVYYAFYHANSQRPWKDWTTCVARSKDLLHWEKSAANPLIDGNRSSGVVIETPKGLRMYTMHPEICVYRNPETTEKPKASR